MKNNRSTRRAFGRRALVFGIAMFAMVTLTAVGFASWLISSNAKGEDNGNVKTETVTQASVKIEVKLEADNNIYFAPVESNTGVVQNFADAEDNWMEKLSVKFDGANCKIQNTDKIGLLKFSIGVPRAIWQAAGISNSANDLSGTWSYDADAAYISLPSYAMDKETGKALPLIVNGAWDGSSLTSKTTFSSYTDTYQDIADGKTAAEITLHRVNDKDYTFSGQMTFGWGARYLGMNPNYYYDVDERSAAGIASTEAPRTIVANLVMLDLINLQKAVNGVTNEDYLALCKAAGLLTGTQTLADLEGAVYGSDAVEAAAEKLAALQESLSTKIATESLVPVYTVLVEAEIR